MKRPSAADPSTGAGRAGRRSPMGKPTPSCSVVIRSFNEEEHIGRLLTGILQQSLRPKDIILVDSGSTDATVAIAERYPVTVVHLPPDEFTFGRSLNEGCDRAKGDLIAVASAHVYPVYPDWLSELVAPFAESKIALTYGRQRGDGPTRFSEHRVFAKWFPEISNGRQTSPFCNNANAAVRRDLWARHPYDEDLPGLEDVSWAMWALAAGYALAYVAEAEVIHVHKETPVQVFNRYRREAMALRRLRQLERFHLGDFARLYLSNIWSDFDAARRARVLRSAAWEILWFRWMQFWGTYRGFALSGPLTSELKHTFYYPAEAGRPSAREERRIAAIDYRSAGHEPTRRMR